jgi:CubicO group peptidase (beta-lactamase class C family)
MMRIKIALFLGIIFIGISSFFIPLVDLNHRKVKTFLTPKPAPTEWSTSKLIHLNKLADFEQALAIENEIVVLKNENNVLPLGNLNRKITHISIGGDSKSFEETSKLFTDFSTSLRVLKSDFATSNKTTLDQSDLIILTVHADNEGTDKTQIKKEYAILIDEISKTNPISVCVFGNANFISHLNLENIQSLTYVPENHEIAQNTVAQQLFGAIAANGKLKKAIEEKFKVGDGILFPTNGRLKFTVPEEVGIASTDLTKIDEIANNGMNVKAYPGCQIVVAIENKIIYRKTFGTATYTDKEAKIKNDDLYDIASVTKIAASTLMALHLHSKQQFDLNKNLGDYLPELTAKTPYHSVLIKDMMAHQAGFKPWIAFNKNTYTADQLNPEIYSSIKKEGFSKQVAEGIFVRDNYSDVMFDEIVKAPLGTKKYEYSDLCFYFVQKIVEKQIHEGQNTYLRNNMYLPMGLRNVSYLPLNFYPKNRIIPTVDEKIFRNQLLQGYVHDQGAALLGGVGGHAGLFSNATDLASIMQLFLNKGKYAGFSFFNEKSIDEFTKQQFQGNKRGAGFDRPNASGGGTCAKSASQQSFGHSGFTGTLAWADPKDKVIFVFLSNRVHPDPENWKLRDMHIRTDIQEVVYQALSKRIKN